MQTIIGQSRPKQSADVRAYEARRAISPSSYNESYGIVFGASCVFYKYGRTQVGAAVMNRPKNSDIVQRFAALSARHKQVAALVCRGLTNKMIAEKLDMSEGTLKSHLHSIYGKLGILSRYELILTLAGLVSQNSIDTFLS